MVTVPVIMGLILAHDWRALIVHIPLVIAWYSGYFCFFAVGLWLKAAPKRKPAYTKPCIVYGAICATASALVLLQRPELIIWALAFAPLVTIALSEAYKGRPRSLLSGETTVAASALLVPVILHAARQPITPHALAVAAILAMYFMTSIPYVKTLIRNRGDKAYLVGSVVSHIIAVIITAWLVLNGWLFWFAFVAMLIVAVRAWWMPWQAQRRQRPWKPKTVGKLEQFFGIAVLVGILVPAHVLSITGLPLIAQLTGH